jgi:hypothetical protein
VDSLTNAEDFVTNAIHHQFFGAQNSLGGQVLIRVPSFGIDTAQLSHELQLLAVGTCVSSNMAQCPTLIALDYYVGQMWSVPGDYSSEHYNINPNLTETFTVDSASEDHRYQNAPNGQPKGNLLNMYNALLYSSFSTQAPRVLTPAQIVELEKACKKLSVHKKQTGNYSSPDWLCTTTRPTAFAVSYDQAFDDLQLAYTTLFDNPSAPLAMFHYYTKVTAFETMNTEYMGYLKTISELTAQTFGKVLLENMKDQFLTKTDDLNRDNGGVSFEFVTNPAKMAFTRITHDKAVDISKGYNYFAEGKMGLTVKQPTFIWSAHADGEGGTSFSNSTHEFTNVRIDGSYGILELVHPYVDNTLFTMADLEMQGLIRRDDVSAPTIQDAALISDLLQLPSYVSGLLIAKDVSIQTSENIEQIIKSDTHYKTSNGVSLFGHQLWGSTFSSGTTSENNFTSYTNNSVTTKGEAVIGILITIPSTGSTEIGFPKAPVLGSATATSEILKKARADYAQQGTSYTYPYNDGVRPPKLPMTSETSTGE